MTFWLALGGALIFSAALVASWWATWKMGVDYGRECALELERAERRAQRKEARGAKQSHQLVSFPGDDRGDEAWLEKLASTGELRLYAEQGDVNRIKSEVAAFWSRLTLAEWSRKRAGAA